jgi:RimJ/RimL family protein N-acetyltransferase
MSHPPHMRELTLRLSLPEDGITDGTVVLRFPTEDHLDGLLAAVADPELREAANMPNVAPEQARASIGYWVLPHARRRGIATRIARLLAEHSFALGVERVAAYVNVDNPASERVLERAGFTREGMVRSMPKPDGRRVDKTLFSLLPGE